MATHHTKDKGDLGVAKAHADLVQQGLMVLFPATEHAPFDLVAYDGETFRRVQVKYRSMVDGAIRHALRSTWSDRRGVHRRVLDPGAVDVICIYCPDTDQCYYVRQPFAQHVTLRFAPSLNGQVLGVRMADDHRRFNPEDSPGSVLKLT